MATQGSTGQKPLTGKDIGSIDDPLMRCLATLCRLNDITFSPRTAAKGFQLVEGRITPRTFISIAKRHGLTAEIKKHNVRLLKHVPDPSILILKDNKAVLVSENTKMDVPGVCSFDGNNQLVVQDVTDFRDVYTGFLIVITHDVRLERRTKQYTIDYIFRSWFYQTVSRGTRFMPHVLLASLLLNIFVFYIPIFTMNVYDRVIPYGAMDTLKTFIVGVSIFLLFDLLITNMRSVIMTFASRRMNDLMSNQLFEHILRLKIDQKPLSAAGFVENSKEFAALREFITAATLMSIIDLPFILLFLSGVAYMAGSLVYVPIIGIVLIFLTNLVMQPLVSKLVVNAARRDTQKQAMQVEAIMSLETIKTMCAEHTFMQRYKNFDDMSGKSEPNVIIMQACNNFTIWMQKVVSIAMVAVGAYLIKENMITVGQLVASSILGSRAMAVGQISTLLFRLNRVKSAIEKINKFMSLPTDSEENREALFTQEIMGKIEFDNVTFFYPGQRQPALKDINIVIKPGERVGIIGRSGAGKSTLLRLMVNLYSPTTGNVMLDNLDSREIAPLTLRHYLHYTSPNSKLFYGTVKENITLANPYASESDIVEAARISGVDKFVARHPKGFNMPVGEHGTGLSAGQSQAVTLARAVVSDANVLLLDEPTANIDNVSGHEFMMRLNESLGSRSLILVSHRASMVEFMDRLIVLHEGRIVADGPREKVLAKMRESNI